jgi:hypothetical protein
MGAATAMTSPSIATEEPNCSKGTPSDAVSFAVSVRSAVPVRAKV